MNYRVLAVSTVATAGLIAFGLHQAQQEPRRTVERVTTVDAQEPPPVGMPVAVSGGNWSAAPQRMAPPPPPPPISRDYAGDPSAADMAALSNGSDIAVGMPKIAYRFAYGFRLPEDAIRPLQERHADMCEAMGPMRCRIITMEQAENEGDYARGSLRLAVASDDARAFGKKLAGAAGQAKGELVSSSIAGEDLSKSIVDTEARLRARTVLRDRLLDVLRSRNGSVSELVAAERGVAQVNEEIDQARSWLETMRARVAFSEMAIAYEAGTPAQGGFGEPVRDAWGNLGSLLGGLIAVLMTLVAVLLPLGLIAALALWLWRKMGLGKSVADGWLPDNGTAREPETATT